MPRRTNECARYSNCRLLYLAGGDSDSALPETGQNIAKARERARQVKENRIDKRRDARS